MINNYVTRRISKHQSKTIIPPTPEEILEDNFNYPDYIEKCLNLKIDYDLFEKFFDSSNDNYSPVDPQISEAFDDFEKSIIEIQKQYEEDLKTKNQSQDYNQAMKKVAKAYFDKLKKINELKLQKEQEFKALTAKREELVNVLNKVVGIKRKIETGSESRLTAFVNRQIPLGELYVYDLTGNTKSSIYSSHRKALERYKRHVFGTLLNTEGIEYKPISKLNFQRSKR